MQKILLIQRGNSEVREWLSSRTVFSNKGSLAGKWLFPSDTYSQQALCLRKLRQLPGASPAATRALSTTSSLRCMQVLTTARDKMLDRPYGNMLIGTESWNQVQSWFVLPLHLGFKVPTDLRKKYSSLLHEQTAWSMGQL